MNKRPKRIAFISEHASPLAQLGGVDTGGQNVYVAQLAKHLADEGNLVDVYTRREDRSTPTVVDWMPNVRVIHVTAGPTSIIPKEEMMPHMAEFEQNMAAYIIQQKLNYELVHANFFMSGMVAQLLKKNLGIPFVITFHALGHVRREHQQEADKFPIERLAIEKAICEEADHIIAECPQDQEDLVNYYDADPNKISIVPCGFSKAEFYPVGKEIARKLLRIDANEKVILQLGRMVPRKGIDNVIRALGKLRERGDNKIKLMVVGGNEKDMNRSNCPEYRRLLDLCDDLGVTTQIQFAGKKDRGNLKLYYAAADIFITTPWYEPFGITPLEAMACGTPVIGANVGGIKYSVADGVTGALVEPHEPLALADKIRELIYNEDLLDRYGRNALAHVNAHFTWKKVAGKMENVYDMLLQSMPEMVNSERNIAAA